MNDRCTPATARRLKELGFEQPEPAPGQVWYENDGTPVIMYHIEIGRLVRGSNGVLYGGKAADIITYAATAPDILRELQFTWNLFYSAIDGMYNCIQDRSTDIFSNENPAEACAEAWEAKQKQG